MVQTVPSLRITWSGMQTSVDLQAWNESTISTIISINDKLVEKLALLI